MSRKRTLEEAIQNAINIHGNKYSYRLISTIKSVKAKVPIECTSHGVFYQSFDAHVNKKNGCPICHYEYNAKWSTRYSDEDILNIARKYKTYTDFSKDPIYCTAINRNLVTKIKEFLPVSTGNRLKRIVYAYEFEDKSVYVGITYNFYKRESDRFSSGSNDAVKVYYELTKTPYTVKLLTDFIPVREAQQKEGEFVEKYRSLGWCILNRVKTGGVGGTLLTWTLEKCSSIVEEYSTIGDLRKNDYPCYKAILRNEWDYLLNDLLDDREWTNRKTRRVRCTTTNKEYHSVKEAEKDTGIIAGTIRNCAIHGAVNKATGTTWEFITN